ncbi:MAG: CBS domain-containing protein [Planctomycetota bacterium]|nr:MAG: CBS domain-containing protein [Planctomycetota bacterium]
MKCLLDDVWALETMLKEGLVESGVARIGAEQEMVLIEEAYRPAPINLQVLDKLDKGCFTTELARFNLEVNLDPLRLEGACLSRMEEQLRERVRSVHEAAQSYGAEVVLTGILPTLRLQDLQVDNMTPIKRYYALNDALSRLRRDAYEFRIHGTDEMIVKQDSVMLESCNTSFQVHLQVSPEDFPLLYNTAQAVAGPVLAVATNSPLLFGRRLWHETRVAVFQQAVDTRTSSYYLQDASSRVSFGRRWVERSALELFHEDIARYRVLLGTTEPPEAPFERLKRGEVPRLEALQLHNSTVYRWNRPCYGISEGKAHLRIENRVLPAGPSVVDEMANAAFWLGLMKAMPQAHPDLTEHLDFKDARANFVAAARQGLGAQFTWLDKRLVPVQELILEHLLPMAGQGLRDAGVDAEDAARYLGIIEARVREQRTGSSWTLDSLAAMKGKGTISQQLCALTAATIEHQQSGRPVHEWPLARLTQASGGWKQTYERVEQIMTTDVVSVNQEELLDLVARIMDWHVIRYVPIEDDELRLVGLVSHRSLLRYLSRDCADGASRQTPVKEIMHRIEDDLVTVAPETLTLTALSLMRKHRVGCLPVVKDGRLVGMLTERNFMVIAGQLLEERLRSTAR